MSNIGNGRLLRVCDGCGLVDDHPRHGFTGPPGEFNAPAPEIVRKVMENSPPEEADRLLASLLDTSSIDLHRDCCRERGCPTGECDELTAGAESKRGKALLNHLVSLQPKEA